MIKVTHKSFGNNLDAEFKAAESIVSAFQQLNNGLNGNVLVLRNPSLHSENSNITLDVLIVGTIEGFSLPVVIEETIKDVHFVSFCVPVELKQQEAKNIMLGGSLDIQVKYNDCWHNATQQSIKQKYALSQAFLSKHNIAPQIYDLIWLKQLEKDELHNIIGDNHLNVICGSFDVVQFFQTIVRCTSSIQTYNGVVTVDAFGPAKELINNNMSSVIELFE